MPNRKSNVVIGNCWVCHLPLLTRDTWDLTIVRIGGKHYSRITHRDCTSKT